MNFLEKEAVMSRKGWKFSEEKILIENYETKTIKELEAMLPGRNADMINAKIKRLKKVGRLAKGKDESAVQRAYEQRGKEVFFTVDQAKK
jgi:hypothetical protein